MSEPNEKSAAAPLVEQQGVNSTPVEAADDPPAGDVRSGGHPDDAEQMDDVAAREEIAGPPDQNSGGPGQELGVGEG